MKTKIQHRITDKCGLKFCTDYNFKTKKMAREELKSNYNFINTYKDRYKIIIWNENLLKYEDIKNKELNYLFLS